MCCAVARELMKIRTADTERPKPLAKEYPTAQIVRLNNILDCVILISTLYYNVLFPFVKFYCIKNPGSFLSIFFTSLTMSFFSFINASHLACCLFLPATNSAYASSICFPVFLQPGEVRNTNSNETFAWCFSRFFNPGMLSIIFPK